MAYIVAQVCGGVLVTVGGLGIVMGVVGLALQPKTWGVGVLCGAVFAGMVAGGIAILAGM